ncbi:MAG TPA: hypothetical protein VGL86_18500 [Polyangia bacterium]
MNRLFASLLMMGAVALSGCGGDSGGVNPPQLWLNYNGDELHVKLQPIMPNPF